MASDPRNTRLIREYNLTAAEYDALLDAQGGGCAICGRLPTNIRLAVDHSHRTRRVRGLLCSFCNLRLLGGGCDKLDLLEAAADYIREPPAWKMGLDHLVPTPPRKRKKPGIISS